MSRLTHRAERSTVSVLHLDNEERTLLIRLLQRAMREVQDELAITETNDVKALIKPREILLRGLLNRIQIPANRHVSGCRTVSLRRKKLGGPA